MGSRAVIRARDLTDEEARDLECERLESRLKRFGAACYADTTPSDPLTPELARWHARKFIASNGPHNVVRQLAEAFLAADQQTPAVKIAERLWQIEKVSRASYDTDEEAFAAVKSMIFTLRKDVEDGRV